MRNHCFPFLVFLLSLTAVSAQEKSEELDPVTITASLNPQRVSATGRNLTVIEGKQFFNLPVHSLDELLRYLPGLEVQSRGPMGSQSDISIRGATFQQVLVVIDGLRVNDPNTGHFSGYIPIDPSEIERIEILKGAGSAIYGSEAVGGVIQIITKAFAAKKETYRKEVEGQLALGQYGLCTLQGGGIIQEKNTAISAGISLDNANGQPQRGTMGYFHNYTVSAAANTFFNNNWKLSLRTGIDGRDFSAQNFYTSFASDTAKEKVKSVWNQMRLSYENGSDKVAFSAGYKQTNDQYAFNSGLSPNSNTSSLLQSLLTYDHTLTEITSLTTGLQYLNNSIRSNDRGNHIVAQAAAFLVFHQKIGSFFSLDPALRLDWNQLAGTETVPQINLSYKLKNLQLRASAGKTIRQADFTEQFNNYNKAQVKSGSIGNPDLQAERSFSYELGADLFLQNLKLSGTLFRRNQSNVIDFVNTPYNQMPRKDNLVAGGTYALASNIAQLNTSGVEADARYSYRIGAKSFAWVSLGTLWLDDESPNGISSFYISSHAKFLATASAYYQVRRVTLSATGIYKTRTPQSAAGIHAQITSDYFLLNVRVDATLISNRLSIFGEADNATNISYSDLLGSVMPGRWLMAGLKITLSKNP